jgi:hypothetical protein
MIVSHIAGPSSPIASIPWWPNLALQSDPRRERR